MCVCVCLCVDVDVWAFCLLLRMNVHKHCALPCSNHTCLLINYDYDFSASCMKNNTAQLQYRDQSQEKGWKLYVVFSP